MICGSEFYGWRIGGGAKLFSWGASSMRRCETDRALLTHKKSDIGETDQARTKMMMIRTYPVSRVNGRSPE